MTDKVQIYVETNRGLIDMDGTQAAAAVLAGLADELGVDQDSITFTGGGEGHYFEVPAELGEAFQKAVGSDAEPKKTTRATRKKAADPEQE